MKFLVDFFPVLAFFAAFYLAPDREQAMYYATAAAIGASFIQVAGLWLVRRRVDNMYLITFMLLLILGGATLLLQDKTFIKWKPTAVNWLFGVAFLGSQFLGKKPLAQRMMEHAVNVPAGIWNPLNLSWAIFFFIMGALNLVVAFNFSEEVWVNFKLFGILGLTLLFAMGQAVYLARHMQEPEQGQ